MFLQFCHSSVTVLLQYLWKVYSASSVLKVLLWQFWSDSCMTVLTAAPRQYGHRSVLGHLEGHWGAASLSRSPRNSPPPGNERQVSPDVHQYFRMLSSPWRRMVMWIGSFLIAMWVARWHFCVDWPPLTQERLPLFDCDTFEVLREREGFTVVVLLR